MKRRSDRIRAQHDLLARQKAELELEIAERLALEARSQQMARMSALGEMASGVAHEINNPVSGIINCAELLQQRLPAGDPCQEVVGRILREGTRIAKIVKSLLSITHPGQKRTEMVKLQECLDPVLTLFQDKLVSHGIDLHMELPADLPSIRGERQQIEQLLLNLIGNACHALNTRFPDRDPGKQLRISASRQVATDAEWLHLEIVDTGTGIPPEMLGRVFDPFFTTKPAGVGTGLGLSLCHEIVSQHGGKIRVESEPQSYTRFIVELPLESATP
jgi:signal transduction histidine kinase